MVCRGGDRMTVPFHPIRPLAVTSSAVSGHFMASFPMGVNDERAVMAALLLKARMAVPPIGAGLADGEFVSEALARPDAGEGDAGDAVILEGEEEAVPVDRAVLG